MDYGLKKWLQYLIYDQWNFNYFIAECVRKLSFLWWIKLEINVIFLGRGKEISNSEKVRLINHEWRWIFIFNCWSVVVPWPPQKDSKMGSKIFWSCNINLYFYKNLLSIYLLLGTYLVSTKRVPLTISKTIFHPGHNTLPAYS